MKRTALIIAPLLGLVLAVAPVVAGEPFKIGVITSLSGSLATDGNITKQGYDL